MGELFEFENLDQFIVHKELTYFDDILIFRKDMRVKNSVLTNF